MLEQTYFCGRMGQVLSALAIYRKVHIFDTQKIKIYRGETDEKGSHPVDRSRYMAVQTPQVFHLELLTKAYEQPYSSLFTDDASVVEAMGHAIDTVPGDRENIKITTPFDLLIAEAMFAR